MGWEERTAPDESAKALVKQFLASPCCEALKDTQGNSLSVYVDPSTNANEARIKEIVEDCRVYIDTPQGKRFRGTTLRENDVREFMQRFAIGAIMAYDAAPWTEKMQLEIVPYIPGGLAKFDDKARKILLTSEVICKYCQLKDKNEPLAFKDKRLGDVTTEEFPFVLGSEEIRHGSHLLNPEVLSQLMARIDVHNQQQDQKFYAENLAFLIQEHGEAEGRRLQEKWLQDREKSFGSIKTQPKPPEQRLEDHIKNDCLFHEHHERLHEIEAAEFVNSLRGRFAETIKILGGLSRQK